VCDYRLLLSILMSLLATRTGISLRLIWLTSVFTLIGGGNYAAEMLMGVIIVDICSARERQVSGFVELTVLELTLL